MALSRDFLKPTQPGTGGTLAATVTRVAIKDGITQILLRVPTGSAASVVFAVEMGAVLTALSAGVDSFPTGYGVTLLAGDSIPIDSPRGVADWNLLLQGNGATVEIEAM